MLRQKPTRVLPQNLLKEAELNTEYLSVFSQNAGKYGSEKPRIWTLFTQCLKITVHNLCLCFKFRQHMFNQIPFLYCLNTIKTVTVLYSGHDLHLLFPQHEV